MVLLFNFTVQALSISLKTQRLFLQKITEKLQKNRKS